MISSEQETITDAPEALRSLRSQGGAMRLIDISPAVRADAPVWPGDTAFGLSPRWSIEAGDSVTVGTVTTTTHVGAHIDGASHVVAGAPSVYATPLEACIGPCLVIDISDLVDQDSSPHGQPSPETVRARIAQITDNPIARLLLRHSGTPQHSWNQNLPGVNPELMRWFGEQGGKLMGIDIASFDPADSKALECHREAVAQGVVLLEGLDLTAAPEGAAELIALPLPWVDADASPVRAVLRCT